MSCTQAQLFPGLMFEFHSSQQNDPFLRRIVIEDKKWILYDNVVWKNLRDQVVRHLEQFQTQNATNEDYALHMAEFQRCYFIRAIFIRSNN